VNEHPAPELFAAYALHALDQDEMREAEKAISAHLPDCEECRGTLEGFLAVVGEIALAAPPREPPRLLWSRIHREVTPRRRQPVRLWALTTAAAVVVAGLSLYGLHLQNRVGRAEDRQARTTEVLSAVSDPQHQLVTLSPTQERPGAAIHLAATFVPGRSGLYLFGSMPPPHPHRVYQVWLMQGSRYSSGGTFEPERTHVLVRIEVDPGPYDSLLITEEPQEGSTTPSEHHVVSASL